MIREAEFRDCKRITDFLRAQHERLGFKPKFAAERVRNTIQVASQNRKLHNCWIVELEGQVEGVLVGITNRIWYSNEREAMDLVYVVSQRGTGYGAWLARRFIRWARTQSSVCRVWMSESLGADARVEQMFERMGMQHAGNVYLLEVQSEQSDQENR